MGSNSPVALNFEFGYSRLFRVPYTRSYTKPIQMKSSKLANTLLKRGYNITLSFYLRFKTDI